MVATLDQLLKRYPGAVSYRLGDNPQLCARLIDLVRSGAKTASTGALRDFTAGEPLPEPGRCDIMLDWDGRPAFVTRTIEVITCRFDEVDEAMALAEGEDRTLAEWQEGHRRYFERTGGFAPDMDVVWERFEVAETVGRTKG